METAMGIAIFVVLGGIALAVSNQQGIYDMIGTIGALIVLAWLFLKFTNKDRDASALNLSHTKGDAENGR